MTLLTSLIISATLIVTLVPLVINIWFALYKFGIN